MSGVDDLLDSDSAVYRTLLESTLAIPWKIDWATMKFAYIGPQIEPLLGWSGTAGSPPTTGWRASTPTTASTW